MHTNLHSLIKQEKAQEGSSWIKFDYVGSNVGRNFDLDNFIISLDLWNFINSVHRLVTVHTHGDFIVSPHWETMPPTP